MFARNRTAATGAAAAAAAVTAPTPASPSASPPMGIPLSPAHLTAARRLQESKRNVPHFYLRTSFSGQGILARRKQAGDRNVAWDAFFVQALAKALKGFDRMAMRFLKGGALGTLGLKAVVRASRSGRHR